MSDARENIDKESPEKTSTNPKPAGSIESPKEVHDSRHNIAGTLESGDSKEDGGEFIVGSEKVQETSTEGKNKKGDSSSKKSKDDKKSVTTFTFDESNLPPAPKMIEKIEQQLRSEIHDLEKRAKLYKGNLFRKSDLSKYSETMIEIREKTILLKRLIRMAGDALKRLFLKMFGAS